MTAVVFIINMIISAALLVFFILERCGKLRTSKIFNCGVYITAAVIIAVISSMIAVVSADPVKFDDILYIGGSSASDTAITDDEMLSSVFNFMMNTASRFVFIIPTYVIALLGCILDVISICRTRPDKGSCRSLLKTSTVAAGLSLAAAIAVIAFGSYVIVYTLGAASVGIVKMLAVTVVFTLFTFGIGLVISIIILPFWLITMGINVAVSIMPFISAITVCGMLFALLHALTVIFAASSLRAFESRGDISKKRAVLYSVLSAIPVINIIALIIINGQLASSKA